MMKFSLADENKSLRLKLSEEQEKFNQQKKHYTDKIIDLENKVSDLEFLNAEYSINLRALQDELINKACGNKKSEACVKTSNEKAPAQSCYALHTSSISGINDYISLLAKAKDDVINYKKESAHLHSELEQFKKKLSTKNSEIEKLKFDLECANNVGSEYRKVCSCHEADSNYESFDDSKSEDLIDDRRKCRHSKVCYSKSRCQQCKVTPDNEQNKKKVCHVAVQVNDLDKIVESHLDEYLRKAKDIVPDETLHQDCVLNKLQDERDYYCREYHRLCDKILNAFRTQDWHPSLECPYTVLDRIRSELKYQSSEINQLKKICSATKESAKSHNSSKYNLEEYVRKLENKESELTAINEKLASKVRKLEDHCHEYKERIRSLVKDNSQQKSVYNQVRLMQDDSERSLFNFQDALRKCDSELNCALAKISQLEDDNAKIKRDLTIVENEKKCLKKNLIQLDREKDSIGIKLDEKTELVVRLEHETKERKKRIAELEQKVTKLDEGLKLLHNINMKAEDSARYAKKNHSSMQHELHDLQKCKETLIAENRRLQDNLSSAVRDCFQSNNELQSTKAEVEELKRRLQSYVSEVRRIEDILQIKEDERRSMLEQLKGLNIEYSSNNSKSRTVDITDNVPDSLSDFRERFHDFESDER